MNRKVGVFVAIKGLHISSVILEDADTNGVKVYYLTKEELEKVRWGAKCSLEDKYMAIKCLNWKHRRARGKKAGKYAAWKI